eukprot:TRINITY_DN3472_c0_g1_i1.p1 TRINITY_DN3472_c0_g1~~TRINITY_DN3472_c0_g1_i1.p1  ORF type:complete len:926 (+),score=158.04 TRINITY_DN3472_c0_g1_i1:1560-4337(+)
MSDAHDKRAQQLLHWLNAITGTRYTSVGQCYSGVAFNLLVAAYYPQKAPITRLWYARDPTRQQVTHNLRLLREALDVVGCRKPLDEEALADGHPQACLDLLHYLKAFFSHHPLQGRPALPPHAASCEIGDPVLPPMAHESAREFPDSQSSSDATPSRHANSCGSRARSFTTTGILEPRSISPQSASSERRRQSLSATPLRRSIYGGNSQNSPEGHGSHFSTTQGSLLDGGVTVGVRMRPPTLGRLNTEEEPAMKWKIDKNTLTTWTGGSRHATQYTFENLFDQTAATEKVYVAMCLPIVTQVANDARNGTIFAYGQTNSGKTYTIRGTESSTGIISYAATDLFKAIELYKKEGGRATCSITVSYLELYNEDLADLLAEDTDQNDIMRPVLRDDYSSGALRVVVDNLSQHAVSTTENVEELLQRGDSRRHIGRNNEHDKASRSHALFQFHVERRDFQSRTAPPVVRSQLNVVDLAGSETTYQPYRSRYGDHDPFERTQVKFGPQSPRLMQRKRQFALQNKEGSNIRKSLLALVRVVRVLAEQQRQQGGGVLQPPAGREEHVPYRDSKLTRLLSNSIGGRANTTLICTINPADIRETQATLNFALVAQRIQRRPKQVVLPGSAVVDDLFREEIARLHAELARAEREKHEADQHLAELRARPQLTASRPKRDAAAQAVPDVWENSSQTSGIAPAVPSKELEGIHEKRIRQQQAQLDSAAEKLRNAEVEALRLKDEATDIRRALQRAENMLKEKEAQYKDLQGKQGERDDYWRSEIRKLQDEHRAALNRSELRESELERRLQENRRQKEAMQQYIVYKKDKEDHFQALSHKFGRSHRKPGDDPWTRFLGPPLPGGTQQSLPIAPTETVANRTPTHNSGASQQQRPPIAPGNERTNVRPNEQPILASRAGTGARPNRPVRLGDVNNHRGA